MDMAAGLQNIASVFLLAICLLVGLMVATASRRPVDTFEGGSSAAEVISSLAMWESTGSTLGSGTFAPLPAAAAAAPPQPRVFQSTSTNDFRVPAVKSDPRDSAVVRAAAAKKAVVDAAMYRDDTDQEYNEGTAVAAMTAAMAANARNVTVNPAIACSIIRATSPDGLDPSCGGNANVGGKLFFRDKSMSTTPNQENSSDPYYLEKVVPSGNNSSLRLTINDDADESFQIWGNSCAAGDCGGAGTMAHKFRADGDALYRGNVNVGKKLFFHDATMHSVPYWENEGWTTKGETDNSSDPYFLEKVVTSGNNSSLRLTMNDDAEESFQIWGNACGTGNCWGEGTQGHKFRADGTASHTGSLNIGKPGTATDYGWSGGAYPMGGSLNIYNRHKDNWTHFPWIDGRNYIRNNTQVDGTFQVNTGDGNWNWIHVRGNHGDDLFFGSDNVNRGIWAGGNRPLGIYQNGQRKIEVNDGGVRVDGQLCVGNTCVSEDLLRRSLK